MKAHIPKFCNWIAQHDTEPICDYNEARDCLFCIFKRDLGLYWRQEESEAGIENNHDADFTLAVEEMTGQDGHVQWKFLDQWDMTIVTSLWLGW